MIRDEPRLVHVTTVPESLTFFEGQIGYFKSRGMDVWALSSPGAMLDEFGARERIRVHGIDMARSITPLRDLLAVLRLCRWLRDVRPDIVDAHTPKGGLLGMIGAWLASVPVRIYHMHGLPLVTATGVRRHLLRWSERVSCLLAHRVLCVSPSLRRTAIEEGLCRPDKIAVVHHGSINGVAAGTVFNPDVVGTAARAAVRDRHGIPLAADVVGFVGRVVLDKGLVELVDSWMDLREERPGLHLLVVGPFETQDPLPADVDALLRTDPRVHLTGLDWDTPKYYAAMDVAVLPTYREGFGIVAIEAAAMQVPVVATRVPGCVDAVEDGVTGTLVPPHDAAALTDAIRGYLDRPELRRRHGRAGRDRVLRDFRQEDVWDGLNHEYTRLLGAATAAETPHRPVPPRRRVPVR